MILCHAHLLFVLLYGILFMEIVERTKRQTHSDVGAPPQNMAGPQSIFAEQNRASLNKDRQAAETKK